MSRGLRSMGEVKSETPPRTHRLIKNDGIRIVWRRRMGANMKG